MSELIDFYKKEKKVREKQLKLQPGKWYEVQICLHATNKNFTTQVISVRMASVNQSDVKIATFLTSYM